MKSDFFTNSFLTNLNKNYISNKKEDNHSKISIVMPSYNQVKFIENSILSILNQEYHSIELIIVDGGSTDGTTDIIKKYEKHIAYWVSEKDEGQSDALNKGFEKCTGEIYGWLNADDVYLPYTFQKMFLTTSLIICVHISKITAANKTHYDCIQLFINSTLEYLFKYTYVFVN
jgi:glycosyltransferase involved in cell wall biosynthesis